MKKRNSFSGACNQNGGQEIFLRYITIDLLKKLTGSNHFEHVSSLNLTLVPEAGQIKYIENLDRFHQLQKLSLSKNCIEKIDNISHLVNLRELDLSNNCLTKIEGLQCLTNIQVLNFSYNKIKHVPKWLPEKLQQLRIFKIEQNRLEDMNEFLWFRGLANFVSLNVLENSFTQMSHYKFYLLFHLPCLEKLDDKEVTLDQRLHAKQMFGQVEIDRLANLVHEKEAECLKLANSLKKTIKNSENKEKLQHILEIKSKEFQIKTGEYDKKLEATNDILKKKTKNFLDANLKHIELEHNLAFYKIDHKFDCFAHDSKDNNSISSLELSMDSSSTFGESPYYGKAFFKQNLISLPYALSEKDSAKSDIAQSPFMSCGWPNCSDCTMPSQNELGNMTHWLHHDSDCAINENVDISLTIPSKPILEQKDINSNDYFENKTFHSQNNEIVEMTKTLQDTIYAVIYNDGFVTKLEDSLEIVKISDFDINKEILNHIKTTTEELRSLIVLQHPNILAAKDKVETLKSLFQVLVKGDLRDAACSPLQMTNFDQQKHGFTAENSGVYNEFINASESLFNKIKKIEYHQAKCEHYFEGGKLSDACELQCSTSKEPDESRTFNGSLQTSTSGLKNLNLENADYFDKFQMPSLKPVSENECEVSENKRKDCKFNQGILSTSEKKPSFSNATKPNHSPAHLENCGWFCNIPHHIYQDQHFLKEFVEKIVTRLFNKKRRKNLVDHYVEKDCRVFARLFQKLWVRKKTIDALDLAIDDQNIEKQHLELLTKCLWHKTNITSKDIQQFMINKDIQIEVGLKTKTEELLKLNILCDEKSSELKIIKNETCEIAKELEKHKSSFKLESRANESACVKNEIQQLDSENKVLRSLLGKMMENYKANVSDLNNPAMMSVLKNVSKDRINVSFSELDSEIIWKQEKLSQTLTLIAEHEAMDVELTKNIQKKLSALQDLIDNALLIEEFKKLDLLLDDAEKRLLSIENKEILMISSFEMQKEVLKEIQKDLLSVENLVKALKSFSKNIHKEFHKKMKQRNVINDEISKKVNEFGFLNNSIEIRKLSMEILEEHCNSLQINSDALYREITERSERAALIVQQLSNNASSLNEFETLIHKNGGDDEAKIFEVKKNDINLQAHRLCEKKVNEVALKNVKRNFETLLVKLHKTNNLFSKIVTQKNVIVSQLGQLKVDLKEGHFRLINIQTKITKYIYSYQLVQQIMENSQTKKDHIVIGLRNIEENLSQVKKDCGSVTIKHNLCKAYLIEVKKDIERNENIIKEIKKRQQDFEEQIISLNRIKDTIMQQNALNSLAAIDGIVAENNGKRERLIAELIEEKLLLKEENEKMFHKLKLSHAEIIHLKIDFCNKIENMVKIKLKLEEKLQMTTKVVRILKHESESLALEASLLKSQYPNFQNQDVGISSSIKSFPEHVKESQDINKQLHARKIVGNIKF